MEKLNICENVNLSLFETNKFNSLSMSVSFILPLSEYTATGNNILAGLFFQGCSKYRDARAIYTRMEEIGARGHSTVVKKGDYHILVLYLQFRQEYTRECFDLLENMIFEPMLNNISREVEATRDRIHSKINDKRAYAKAKTIEYTFRGEPFGIDGDGCEKYLNMDMEEYYRYFLAKSNIEIMVVGNIKKDYIKNLACSYFHFEPRESIVLDIKPIVASEHHFVEKMDIVQSKLCIGINAPFDNWESALIANCILGGGSGSMLFSAVREEKGLCYYIVSTLYRYRQFVIVEAGIDSNEKNNVIEMVKKVLNNFSPTREEIEKAKQYLVSSMKTTTDSQGATMDFYLSQGLAHSTENLEEVINKIQGIDNLDNVFQNLTINTVFSLESDKNA